MMLGNQFFKRSFHPVMEGPNVPNLARNDLRYRVWRALCRLNDPFVLLATYVFEIWKCRTAPRLVIQVSW